MPHPDRNVAPNNSANMDLHVTKSADGRFHIAYHLKSGWDGFIFVNDDGTALMEETYVPRPMRDATYLMEKLGVRGENDVHKVEVKSEIERKKDIIQKQRGHNSSLQSNQVLVERKLTDLPCKVRNQMYDRNGAESHEVTIEHYAGEGVDIAHVFLLSVDAKKTEVRRPHVRRNTNRTRHRDNSADDDDSSRRTRHRDNRDEGDDLNDGMHIQPDDDAS